ncbi:hypothetical protein K2173_005031 [Erythroxylum novogranatense]|uniref:Glutamate receptor n=1 Tax=Erythroxylum novogranatense TaxID=1862640 RepID=A0AAV8TBK1_9ROSI|nr:hypothetical protein K2173_005031 [Erythroxylum novogranatense]
MGFVVEQYTLQKALLVVLMVFGGLSSKGVSVNANTRPKNVNIGALLSFDSTIGKVAKVAIEAAVKDVNNDPSVLGVTKLHLTMQDTAYSGYVGLLEALRLMKNRTVAIIGPQFSVTAHVVSHIANELQVPLVSFAATDPVLSSLQYQFFLRTCQSDIFQMAAIAEIIDYYGWRDVIAIFVDDDHGRNAIAALGGKLSERRCKISYKAPLSSQVNRVDIMNTLLKVAMMESRILVLLAYPEWGLEVLDVAQYLGMTATGYVWIVTDWLTTALDTESPLSSDAVHNMQGVLTLRVYSPESQQKLNLLSRWTNLSTRESTNGSLGLNSYGLFAYDTVWLVAYALDKIFSQGGNVSFSRDPRFAENHGGSMYESSLNIFDQGNLLFRSILQVYMNGITGPMKVSSDGNLIQPAYEVINVIGTGLRRVGYWSNDSGLSVFPPEKPIIKPSNRSSSSQRLYTVIWPGETTMKPRGWVFPSSGRYLKIGVPNRVSYRDFVSVEGVDVFRGYCIDIFTAALNLLPFAVPYKFYSFGDGHENPNRTELLHLMSAGVYDAVVGDIAITPERARTVDFTQPYVESGLIIVAPVRKSKSSAWAFLRPFTSKMWCTTAIFFFIIGAVVCILEHKLNKDFRGPPRRQVVTILWFGFSTLTFTHKENLISTLGRLVLVLWLFIVLILNSSYTASLTSILTVEQLSSPIKGIESLVSSKDPIGYQRGSFAESYLVDNYKIDRSRLIPLNSEQDYAKALKDGPKKGGVTAVVDQRAYMDLFLSKQCEFSIIGQEFTKIGWGFAFPRESQLASDLSTAILKLSENGELQRINDKWLLRSTCRSEGAKEEENRLELKSFWGLFLICGIACLFALLLYIIRIVQQFYKYSSVDPESLSRSSGSERIQSFLLFVGEKEEEAKIRSKRRRMDRLSNTSIEGGESTNCSFKSIDSGQEL